MRGVPESVLLAKDHIQVRAALVRLLGGGNEALVWSRIAFRVQHVAFAHQVGDRQWWQATQAEIADEVGLSVEQTKTALRNLVNKGFMDAEQHSLPVQTYSYCPVILQSVDSPIGSVPIGEEPDSSGAIATLQEGNPPIPPLYQEREEVEEVLSAAGASDYVLIPASWRPNQRHVDRAAALHLDVVREYQRFRAFSEKKHRRLKNWNAGFTNWLRKTAEFNQEAHGSSPKAKLSTVEHGRTVDRIIAEREARERLAVNA